jgi:AcrR family transcriptional regulator
MFTKTVNPDTSPEPGRRKRGRPPGTTPQGEAARARLYATALGLIGERGYEGTTLRDVAHKAGVSATLLYRYFPNKRALLVAFYDELSIEQQARAAKMPAPAHWRDRFMYSLDASLDVLRPHRRTLAALMPALVAAGDDGLFGAATAGSRERVMGVFQDAVTGAKDAPRGGLAPALGRLLYLAHLGIILWWLLDRSANQRTTSALVALIRQILPAASLAVRLPHVGRFVTAGDRLFSEGLLG